MHRMRKRSCIASASDGSPAALARVRLKRSIVSFSLWRVWGLTAQSPFYRFFFLQPLVAARYCAVQYDMAPGLKESRGEILPVDPTRGDSRKASVDHAGTMPPRQPGQARPHGPAENGPRHGQNNPGIACPNHFRITSELLKNRTPDRRNRPNDLSTGPESYPKLSRDSGRAKSGLWSRYPRLSPGL
jgi:hypothetical protein